MAARSVTPLIEHSSQTRPSLRVPNRLHQTRGVHPDRGATCGICWADIQDWEATYTHLDCMNAFHSVCLEPAIARGMDCPACLTAIHHEDLFGALKDIDNFELIASVPPDMDETVSKWFAGNPQPDIADDWVLIREARKPLLTIAREEAASSVESILYWNKRRQDAFQSRRNRTNPRPDFKAQLDHQSKCDAAAGAFQKQLREACQHFLEADQQINNEIRYHLTSKRYYAHHGLWSHKRKLEALREKYGNESDPEARLAEEIDMKEPEHIMNEFQAGHEPLRHLLYGKQYISQYYFKQAVNAAKADYTNTLQEAWDELNAGDWDDNRDDRLKALRRVGILDPVIQVAPKDPGRSDDSASNSYLRQAIDIGWDMLRRIRG